MKKLLSFIVVAIPLFYSCTEATIDPITNDSITKISMDSTRVIVGVGESFTLTLKHSPENLAAPTYVWSSLSPSIAEVDANGVVKGNSIGTTRITATSKNNSNLSTTCTVTVKMRGTVDFPYLINSIQDLKAVRDSVNSGKVKFISFNYKLMSDLDFSNENYWNPISSSQTLAFKGVFDGNGKTIKNIKIGTSNTQVSITHAGLFGYISSAEIKNLSIEWLVINSSYCAGGIVGFGDNGAKINNCHTSGNIMGRKYSGGIVGITSDCDIINCYSNGVISPNVDSSDTNSGGIVAQASDSRINDCYSIGDVSGYHSGGILGTGGNNTTITNCYSKGIISSLGGLYPSVGGIIGYGFNTTINNCYSTGSIKSDSYGSAGGIAAVFTGKIYNSYSTAIVIARLFAGGIAGGIDGAIYNCYSTGSITSKDVGQAFSGGIVALANGTICNCYSSSAVISNKTSSEYSYHESTAGGICGKIEDYDNKLDICYCIALNRQISATGLGSNFNAARIVNSSSSTSNNYASATIVVKKGATTITNFSDTNMHGNNLIGNPVDFLNAYVSANPIVNGVPLLKWNVTTNVNNGFPTFK